MMIVFDDKLKWSLKRFHLVGSFLGEHHHGVYHHIIIVVEQHRGVIAATEGVVGIVVIALASVLQVVVFGAFIDHRLEISHGIFGLAIYSIGLYDDA